MLTAGPGARLEAYLDGEPVQVASLLNYIPLINSISLVRARVHGGATACLCVHTCAEFAKFAVNGQVAAQYTGALEPGFDRWDEALIIFHLINSI